MAPPLMRMFTQHRTTSDGSRPRLDMSKDCGGEEVVTGVSQVIGETSGSREADAGDGSIAVGAFLACGSGVLAAWERHEHQDIRGVGQATVKAEISGGVTFSAFPQMSGSVEESFGKPVFQVLVSVLVPKFSVRFIFGQNFGTEVIEKSSALTVRSLRY